MAVPFFHLHWCLCRELCGDGLGDPSSVFVCVLVFLSVFTFCLFSQFNISGGSSISDLMSVSLAALERTTITTSNSDDDDLHDGISQPSSINSNLETHSSKLSKAYALHTVVRMPLEAANASVAHYPENFHSNSTSTASTSLGTSSFPPVYSNIETLDITAQVPATSDSEYHSILSPLNTNQSKVPSSIGPQPASVSSAFTPFHKSSSSSSPPPPASIQGPMSVEPSSTPSKVLAPAMFSFSKSPHLAVFPASMSSLSSTSSSPSPTPAFATWTEEVSHCFLAACQYAPSIEYFIYRTLQYGWVKLALL